MLLGRTANGLFWMHRYIERAESTARLIDAGMHVALTGGTAANDTWGSVLQSAGTATAHAQKYDEVTGANTIDFMLRDKDNPSSVLSVIDNARNNGRMVRTALTREVWENLNDAWMKMKDTFARPVTEKKLPEVLSMIKRETALIRGAFEGTMLRDERFNFARIGTYLERADNTARILDVKYYVLLPAANWVGTSLDNMQWETILRSVSAHRSYRWVYEAQSSATNIADFLILNRRMPRSLAYCMGMTTLNLRDLERDYGTRHGCHETAEQLDRQLYETAVGGIFDRGLHEFLQEFMADANRLSTEIAESYRFY